MHRRRRRGARAWGGRGGGEEGGGAAGVFGGGQGEVEVEGEEELEFQVVELAQREAADLGPGGRRVSDGGQGRAGIAMEMKGKFVSDGVEKGFDGAHQRELRQVVSSMYLVAVMSATRSSRCKVLDVNGRLGYRC